MNVWDFFNYFFGIVAVIGPAFLVYAYVKTIRHRITELNKK
jgi:threonine/homoserine/homoserine lactone efflux protein